MGCCSLEAMRVPGADFIEEIQSALQALAAETSSLRNAVEQHVNHLQTRLEQSTETVRFAALHSLQQHNAAGRLQYQRSRYTIVGRHG